MPTIKVEGYDAFEVPEATRLVLAIESSGVDILHRCGGWARCTTCRVTFSAGEPAQMTEAERDKLRENNDVGKFRLACQIECNEDMTLRPLMTLTSSGLPDPGPEPEAMITPEPVWTMKE